MRRSAVKTGIRAFEKGRESLAETREKIDDLVAETQAELRSERFAAETDTEIDDVVEEVVEEVIEESEFGVQASDTPNIRNIVN